MRYLPLAKSLLLPLRLSPSINVFLVGSELFKRSHLSHKAEEVSGDEAAEKVGAEDSIKGKTPEMDPSPAPPAQPPSTEDPSSAAARRALSPSRQRGESRQVKFPSSSPPVNCF